MDGKIYGNHILDRDIQKLLILSWLPHGIGRLILPPIMVGKVEIQGEKKGSVKAMKVNGLGFVLKLSTFIRPSVFYLSDRLF